MPISPDQHRAAAGRFPQASGAAVRHRPGSPLRPRDTGRVRRVSTPLHAGLVLLLVANVAAAPHRLARAGRGAGATSPLPHPCPPGPALTVPEALHEVAEFARAPISSAFDTGRGVYYHFIAQRCPPPESVVERVMLQVGDAAVGALESVVLGPTGALAIREGANALDLAGNALEGKPLDAALLVDALLAQGGIKPRAGNTIGAFGHPVGDAGEGSLRLRGDEQQLGAEPYVAVAEEEEGVRRCRRDPGGPCAPSPVAYSTELDALLRAHHDQGLDQQQADQRGIVPDPQRPGWHVRVHHGQRKAFLHLQGRYFRARSYRLGDCERVALYAARVSHRGGIALSHPLGGHRLVDIAESPGGAGPQFMTQAEYNVRFRGFGSMEAANVYEQAVRNAPAVHLSQAEQAAIVHYARAERPLLDVFLQRGPAPASQLDQLAQQAEDLRRGLAQIPPHVGPVYRGVTVPARALEGLQVGHTVYCRSFLRASGDRAVAVRQLEARGNEVDEVPLLVTLRMTRAAHPVGLYTLQDEAGVLIDNGRVFKVIGRREGELELEEVGVARQAFGQRGARALDLS